MVDYTLLADNDPGGDLETAFAVMSAQTAVRTRNSHRVNDIMIAKHLGFTAATEFLNDVEAALDPRVVAWLRGDGIDMAHPDVATILDQINPRHKDAALAMGKETVPKYPGLRIGHLATARQMRAEGKI